MNIFEVQMKNSILEKLLISQTHYGQEARIM